MVARKTRIRQSARDLFAERGFADTTITRIAEGAGVSEQTIYAVFGGKAGIARAMLEEMEESVDETSWVARIIAEKDPREQLRLFVSLNRALFETGAPILRALLAARSEPGVAELTERGDRRRRDGASELIGMLARESALRDGLKPADAAGRLWLLTSVEQYMLATDGLGWSPERYERWLGALLAAELLAGYGGRLTPLAASLL